MSLPIICHLQTALDGARKSFSFEFDDKLYTIRRNLMIASSIVMFSTFISPPTSGNYEINLGILKGELRETEHASYFLLIICAYYLLWFYIHCRKLVVNNYSSAKSEFLSRATVCRANTLFQDLVQKNRSAFPSGIHTTGFQGHKFRHDLATLPLSSQSLKHMQMPDTHTLIKEAGFEIFEEGKDRSINYNSSLSKDDLVYLQLHLDLFWRGKFSQLFTTAIPIAYASFAISYKVIDMYIS